MACSSIVLCTRGFESHPRREGPSRACVLSFSNEHSRGGHFRDYITSVQLHTFPFWMALAKALRCLGCIGSLPESWWCPHRPCASLGQEGQRQLGLVQLILTWQGRYND